MNSIIDMVKLYIYNCLNDEYDIESKLTARMLRMKIKDYIHLYGSDRNKEHLIEDVSDEELAKAIERLSSENNLDLNTQGKGRKEQSYLSYKLFSDNKFALHVHVELSSPLCSGYMTKPCTYQHQG